MKNDKLLEAQYHSTHLLFTRADWYDGVIKFCWLCIVVAQRLQMIPDATRVCWGTWGRNIAGRSQWNKDGEINLTTERRQVMQSFSGKNIIVTVKPVLRSWIWGKPCVATYLCCRNYCTGSKSFNHMLPRQVKPRLQSTSYIELRRRRWRDFSAGKHLGDGMLVCLKDLENGSHDKKIGMTSAKSQIGGVEILHVNGHGIKRSEVLLSFSPSWHFSFISVCKEGQGNRWSPFVILL